jgi:iron complex transport system permease protein
VRTPQWRLSLRIEVRTVALIAVVGALVLVVATWSMSLGEFPIPFVDVLETALGGGDGRYDFVVRTLRLPRVLTAALVGAGLAASGAIFQSLVRNPLVSPDVIGVSEGATVAAVWLIVNRGPIVLLPLGAFVGGLATAGVLYVLAWRRGISGNRLVLVGIGVDAFLTALTLFMLVRYPIDEVSSAVLWTSGTLFDSDWDDVGRLAVGLALLVPVALALMARLQVLQLGDDCARGLGVRTEATRLGLFVVAVGLVSVAVAAAGPIVFVALVVPHVARLLAGPMTAGVLVLAGLLGALLLVGADLAAQRLFAPVSLPAGVLTAAVGAPGFLFLLYRTNRSS